MGIKLHVRALSEEEEIKKIHAQLWNCSGNMLQRINPPSVACWLAKYNGEIVAPAIISPCADCFGGKVATQYPALFMIDSLSRFVNCSWLINRASIHDGQLFMNDGVRTIGKPRRVITVRGGPTLPGQLGLNRVTHSGGK